MGVFNKTIILLALVGYEMIIANSALRASLAIFIFSYPTRPRGIIVKYNYTSQKYKDDVSIVGDIYCFIYK